MAKLHSAFSFTGSLGDLTAYKNQKGEIIVQRKGGPSRHQLETSPYYENHRSKYQPEFGGCSKAGKAVKDVLWPVQSLGTSNLNPRLTQVMRAVQKYDTTSEFGKRHVRISALPHVLEGFQINSNLLLESVLRTAIQYSISREEKKARVTIPALIPGINFVVPPSFAWYRIVMVLGAVPDILWTEHGYQLTHNDYRQHASKICETDWAVSSALSPAVALEIIYNSPLPDEFHTWMLTLGVQFGKTGVDGKPEPIKKVGCARVLMMA